MSRAAVEFNMTGYGERTCTRTKGLLRNSFPAILNAITLVKPETVIGWHGRGFYIYRRWKSRADLAAQERQKSVGAIWSSRTKS
jgi:hypothetical protein